MPETRDDDRWYFAYGSNMLRQQKENRTGPIRAERTCRLLNYRLAFDKRGCMGEVYANIVEAPGGQVWGVAYRCCSEALDQMDYWEGVPSGHYERIEVVVETGHGERLDAVTYVAGSAYRVPRPRRPSRGYLGRIIEGATEHHLPDEYVRSIRVVAGVRTCRSHERPWRDRCVDSGLRDEWLEALNDLSVFDLISICEGHPNEGRGNSKSGPHVNLRMKAEFVPGIADRWSTVQPQIGQLLAAASYDGAAWTVELRRRVRHTRGLRIDDYIVVHIDSRIAETPPQSERDVSHWFESCVRGAAKIDEGFRLISDAMLNHA